MAFFLFTTAFRLAPEPTPASYPMDAGGKAAGSWRWPLTSS